MKKYLFLVICAAAMSACDNVLDEVFIQYEEISAAKDEKKKDVNFLIHNDHYQKGKETK